MEQKNKGRARARIAVFFVLAVHGIVLMAFLMAGCNKPQEPAPLPPDTNPPAPAQTFAEPTNAPAPMTPEPSNASTFPAPPSNAAIAPTQATQPTTTTQYTPPPVTEPITPSSTEYKIAKGDNFSTIAKKLHVPVKAIQEANPGVDSKKLKIGQVIRIPAAATTPPALSTLSPTGTPVVPQVETSTYTVKSGDTLSRIAGRLKVSLKALRSENNLRTDRITVGQKLKVPAKTGASAPSSTAPVDGTTGSIAPDASGVLPSR